VSNDEPAPTLWEGAGDLAPEIRLGVRERGERTTSRQQPREGGVAGVPVNVVHLGERFAAHVSTGEFRAILVDGEAHRDSGLDAAGQRAAHHAIERSELLAEAARHLDASLREMLRRALAASVAPNF
jgi:hypothetical protein